MYSYLQTQCSHKMEVKSISILQWRQIAVNEAVPLFSSINSGGSKRSIVPLRGR